MPGRTCLKCCLAACIGASLLVSGLAPSAPASEPVSYAHEVLPLLRARCQGCHQRARAEGGVDLTSLAGMLAESESGLAALKPGDPDSSELIAQVTPDAAGEALMPKTGAKLTPEEIDLLRRWIAEGAKIDAASDRPTFDREHPPVYAASPTIGALDVSPDGKLLAVSGVNETLLLDAAAASAGKQTIVNRLIGMSERIESVRFSPDGSRLAVAGGFAGEQGELQIWDVATGDLVLSHPATSDTLRGVAWSPDGKNVAFGGADTNLYVIDAETGDQKMEQGAHSDWVLDAVFSTDGKYLASGSRDQTLKLTQADSGRLVENITSISPNIIGGQIFAIARHPGRDMVAVGGSEGVPRTYMLHRVVDRKIGDDSNLVRAYPPMPGRVFGVAFSPDGRRLAVASSDSTQGHLHVFAVPDAFLPPDDIKLIEGKEVFNRSAEEKARLDSYLHQGAVRLAYAPSAMPPQYAVAFTPDSQAIVTAGADGLVRFHSAVHGTLLSQFSPFPTTTVPAPPSPEESGGAAQSVAASEIEAPPIPDTIEFLTDVMPQLGKLGCNAGTCHGSRAGQNGFQLSLRGYDPLADHRSLTDDLAARRINRARPEASLMLAKPAGGVPHGGGQVLQPGSRRYEILRRWIAQGAVYNSAAPRVVGIEVAPQNPIVDKPGDIVQMHVTARYSDGSTRDVTADAFVDSGDTECATSDPSGKLTAVRRGEAPVLARFEGSYAATTLTVMGDRGGYEWASQPAYNTIDELVDVKLERMKINPSGICTDAEFIRRAYLDLAGIPPTAEQIRAFLGDERDSRTKRTALVDQLIGSDDYIEHWTNRWADLLMVNSRFLGAKGAAAYRGWIRQAVAENKPYDKFVHELFTSTGSNREHPGGSYFKILRTPDMIAETTTQVFMGVRFNCNKCHDHPFERWTQDDYYGWAAFFADVKLERDPASGDEIIPGSAVEDAKPLFEMISDGSGGQQIHLRTGKAAAPRLPFPAKTNREPPAVLRQRAADWLTSADNRYFATSYVNRLWAHLTGVGLIEPIDDIRAGNPPSNPELLKWLTEQFVASGFDTQALIRLICQSRTYQLSGDTNPWNEDDRRNYSHALPRRLPAEALYDAVYRVVGSVSHLPGMPAGARAAALPDSMMEVESGLLGKLGRPARESGCECERSSDLQLGPVMALINGPTFADAIDDPESELAKLEAATPDDAALAREVFVRVLGREPNDVELAAAVALLADPGAELEHAARAFAARTKELEPGFEAWRSANRPIVWTDLKPAGATANIGVKFETMDDNSIFVTGDLGKCVYQIVAGAPGKRLRGLRLEALADDRLPAKGPGRAPNGNFVVNTLRLFIMNPDQPAARRKVKLRTAEADFSQAGFHVSGLIDNKPPTGWAVAPEMGKNHVAVFAFTRPLRVRQGEQLVVELDQQYDDTHTLGRFRLAVTEDGEPLMRPDHGDEIRTLLLADKLEGQDLERLRGVYFGQDAQYRGLDRAQRLLANPRLAAVQDLAWALINSPAFLFNH